MNQLRKLKKPPLTCWPVLTEAVWLLRTVPRAVQTLFTMVSAHEIRIAPFGEEASDFLAGFLDRYHSLRTDLADAALVFLAEREGINTVFTLDRKDFSIYRLTNGKAFQVIPESATLVGLGLRSSSEALHAPDTHDMGKMARPRLVSFGVVVEGR